MNSFPVTWAAHHPALDTGVVVLKSSPSLKTEIEGRQRWMRKKQNTKISGIKLRTQARLFMEIIKDSMNLTDTIMQTCWWLCVSHPGISSSFRGRKIGRNVLRSAFMFL
ncbi:uncharacterized protein GJ701_008658 isoform 1-T1 [Geothlypis trichas]